MKTRTKLSTFEIVHPEDDSFAIIARRPGKLDALEYFDDLSKYQEALGIKDPDNLGQFLKNDKGEPIHVIRQRYPVAAVLNMLKKQIESWRGLLDEDGKEIPFAPENVRFLFNDDLDYEEEVDEEIDKKKTGRRVKARAPYWQFILKKLREGADSDPKTSA